MNPVIFILLLCVIFLFVLTKCSNTRFIVSGGAQTEGGSVDIKELTEYYNALRDKLTDFDSNTSNMFILQLHAADWCKYCQLIKEPWQEATKDLPKSKFIVNVLDHAHSKGVRLIPTIVLQTPDKQIHIYDGKKKMEDILSWISNTSGVALNQSQKN